MPDSTMKATPPSTPPTITPIGLRGEEVRVVLGNNGAEVIDDDAVEVVEVAVSLISVVYTT